MPKDVTMTDIKQLLVILFLGATGVIAACYQNWQLVGTFATGAFALLHFGKTGDQSPNDTAGQTPA